MLVNIFFSVHPVMTAFTGASAAEAVAVSEVLGIAVRCHYSKGSRLLLVKEREGLIESDTLKQLRLSQNHVCFSLEMKKTGTASLGIPEYQERVNEGLGHLTPLSLPGSPQTSPICPTHW